MRRLFLAMVASAVLHGMVLAALLPRAETPPRALPILSVEIVEGMPGQRRAAARANPHPAGAAPARNAVPARRADAARETAPREAGGGGGASTAEANAGPAEAPSEEPAATERTPQAAASGAREVPERTRVTRSSPQRRASRQPDRGQARPRPETRPETQADQTARSRHDEGDGRQETASTAAQPGELVPPRYGVGGGANPLPPYPETARYLGQQGTVMLRVRVAADGRPDRVEVAQSSGHELLDEAARETVGERWRFTPARRGGTPVAATVLVPIRFRLDPS